MCILPDATPGNTPSSHTPAARRLPAPQRQHLALQALAGTRPIAQLAHDHHVSRKFVYQQAAKAENPTRTPTGFSSICLSPKPGSSN